MKRNLVIIAIISFMASCGNQAPKQNSDEVVSHEGQSLTVTLVNGEKWKVNFATNKGIRNMKDLVQNIDDNSKLSDYRKLGNGLQKEFRQIFQRCDMTGEAHNQLHNYLLPMTEWFAELSTGNLSQCRKVLNELKEHLDTYDLYFK